MASDSPMAEWKVMPKSRIVSSNTRRVSALGAGSPDSL